MGSNHNDLTALKSMISEADRILETAPPLPENRTGAAREILQTAIALADDLLKHSPAPAAALGSKGGSATARRHGKAHYQAMAAKRKIHGGGRPRKESE